MGSNPTPVSPEALLAEVEWVRRVARALVGRGESDEVVQQTYLQALAAPPAAGPVRRWLSTVVRNVVRRRARDDATRGRHEARAPIPAKTPEPGEAVARAELHRRVVEAVLALDEPYCSTLLLRFFEDQPAEAIARAQALPVETVRTRVKRGLAQLRTRLERAAGGDDAAGMAARALWFDQLNAFAGDGTKGAVTGGAAAAGAVAVGITARAVWIASGLAAAAVVGAAALWIHSRSVSTTNADAMSQTRAPAPPIAAARNGEAPSEAATRTPDVAAVAPTAAPASMKPLLGGPRGVVRGRVLDARGAPVAGAQVRAQPGATFLQLDDFAESAWQEATSNPPRPLSPGSLVTRTDAAGRFELHSLSTIPDWSVGAFEAAHGAALLVPLHFDPEHRPQEIELTLTAGALVHGRVRDELGRPIADASVDFGWARGHEANRTSSWTSYYTAADGTWRAGYCCGEAVATRVKAAGFVEAPLQWTPLEVGRTDVELAIILHSKGETLVDGPIAVVDPATGATRGADDLESLLERVLGPAEEERPWHSPPGYGRIAVGAAGTADARPVLGARIVSDYAIGRVDVARGRYELSLPADFRGTLFLAVRGTVVGTAALDDVAQPPVLPFEVMRAPPKRVTSRLVVRVVDAITREPVDLARGWMRAAAPLPVNTNFFSLAPREPKAGVVEFVAAPGRVKVCADLAGYASTATEIFVAPDERSHDVTLALDRATAGVRGRALRVDGSPMQRSNITLYRVTPDGVVETTGSQRGTNMDGEFEILGLAAAEHVVVVTAADGAYAVGRMHAADPPTEFELTTVPGTRTEIHLMLAGPDTPASARSSTQQMFRIVDEAGIPVLDMFGGWCGSSGGSETLEATLQPGSYRVIVWRDGFHEATCSFEVPSDDPIELELEPAR